jgi:hypothetical protein
VRKKENPWFWIVGLELKASWWTSKKATLGTYALLWPNIWQKQLKWEKIYFGSWYQIVESAFTWLHASGQQKIMGEKHVVGVLLHSWWIGSRVKLLGRSQGKIQPPRTCSQWRLPSTRPHFPQLHHLPLIFSYSESINGSNYFLRQSLHNVIVSGNALADMPRGVLYQSPRHFLIQVDNHHKSQGGRSTPIIMNTFSTQFWVLKPPSSKISQGFLGKKPTSGTGKVYKSGISLSQRKRKLLFKWDGTCSKDTDTSLKGQNFNQNTKVIPPNNKINWHCVSLNVMHWE